MSKIIPLWDRVVVTANKASNQTSSGIILPESKEKPNEWTVVSVWWAVKELSIWDVVLYKKYGPTEVKLDWTDYLILDTEDVLAKVA